MQLRHNPESDPATPNIKSIERAAINAQVFEWLAAGNQITQLPPCLSKRYAVRWSDKDFRLVER